MQHGFKRLSVSGYIIFNIKCDVKICCVCYVSHTIIN